MLETTERTIHVREPIGPAKAAGLLPPSLPCTGRPQARHCSSRCYLCRLIELAPPLSFLLLQPPKVLVAGSS